MKDGYMAQAWDDYAKSLPAGADLAAHQQTFVAGLGAAAKFAVLATIEPERALAEGMGKTPKEAMRLGADIRRVVAPLWDSFCAACMPFGAPQVQRTECRRAFYAGARGITNAMMQGVSDGESVTSDDETFILIVEAEFEEFYKAVKEGRA